MKVIKRNGRTEELDISKIKKYTTAAVEGIENVSLSELEVDAKIQFRDMITTEEIQQTLIKTAVDKIDIDRPNWTFVAARLFLYDLYHKVTSFNGYTHLREYFERGEKEGRIMLGLKEKYDLDDLNNYIKTERDLQFNYLGIKTLYDRYLIKDKQGKPIELPQHMFMAIAMFLAQNELDSQSWAKKFYDLISKFEVMLATPTLSNARTTRHQLSSCYVGSVPDNIEGIFDSYKEMALLSKFGGGIGWDWSKVRAMGGSIDGHKNAAGGIIPFLKITNDIAVAVDQLGTRKGAIAVYIEPWHMDINDFLDLRKNSGEERRRAHEIFPALWINDLFMKRLANNEKWTLFDPVDVSDLCDVWGEEFEAKYIAYENDPNISKSTVLAKELWKKILTSYFETGMPFLCFKDNANRVNPNSHKGIIRSSNLCTEIFQNTQPNHYKTKVIYADGSEELFEENEEVVVNGKITKKAKKITALDTINGKDIFIVEKGVDEGATAVCNLASVNLSKIHTPDDIKRVVPIAVRMLDNVIELNF
ncbi:MAG: ribonucleoside-diphosphate reductase subunit alpha, partial [Campylobacter sp.]|nr:ribonucleoside-diphosphate reductase subunit alpha [Campylobacter sp.]